MNTGILVVAIVVFIGIYGGFHYYLYRKLLKLLPQYRRYIIASLILFACSIFIVEIFTHGNIHAFFVAPLSWLTFLWMGFIYLFFVLSITFDLLEKLAQAGGINAVVRYLASPRRTIWLSLLVIGIGVYGYLTAKQIYIERITVESVKLSQPLRLVLIADLHLGLLSEERHIERIVDEISAIEPDVIVSAGDLVDMQLDHLENLIAQMARLNARLGKYAVYGNHEVLAGLEQAREFTERAGFVLLSNAGKTVNSAINIIGVDDPAVEGRVQYSSLNEVELLKRYSNGLFNLLLKHQPVVEERSVGYFDLQLSGHIHGGQIFPFGLLTWLVYRVSPGLSQVGSDSWLYVSRGTGTWGPPLRVLARPEITVVDLLPVKAHE
ncbi:metallophosphoesterase [Kaarinaea lacus]